MVEEKKTDFYSLEKKSDELEKLEIELLLEAIYRHYGYDFRDYAFSSIQRRIWYRIQTERLQTVSALTEQLLHNPLVMERLISDFSINVTEMFRDPTFFLAFREQVIPLLKDLPLIQIWHAGCATGEEAYSMAILLYEEGLAHKARIYATDMNEKSLEQAQKGEYPLVRMKDYTSNYVKSGGKLAFSEYYKASSDRVHFHPFLRERMIFAQHNLVTDSSINEFQVIICRNVMIYFNKELQDRVHQLFYESLSTKGFLGLGNREGLGFTKYASSYEEVNGMERLYRKIK
jgi:chemotaxis protein methyltransferase CheR